jgi:acyl-coenzyme A synthetase/AMP-(fatty) acid ligase
MNLLHLQEQPSQAVAAIDSAGTLLTYGELVAFSNELNRLLPARSFLFLLTENNVGGIAWSIGSIQAGAVPLILNAHIEDGLYRNLLETYQPPYICLPAQRAETAIKNGYNVVAERFGYVLLRTDAEECPMHEELSHLLPTSGSTGSPKLVRHKYENIEAAALNISTFFELSATDRPLMVLPLYYTMGLSMVFSHLFVGATILITDLSMTDKRFWAFLKEQRATSFTGVPYSFEILNLMRFFRMDLPDLTLLTQGGGKMPHSLNLKFAEHCQKHGLRWIATYGQSEGTARMAYLPAEYAISKCGSIGRAVPNATLSLIDRDGKEITAPHTSGEMCYRGRNVTMGYARKREDLLLGDERHGFLRTGDLAYFDEDGCYYIVGRMGRFLKLYGARIGLDECEQIIKARFPVECACVGTDEKMIIYLTNAAYQEGVKEELVSKTKVVASAFVVKIIPEIPKNEAGKILYNQLAKE